MQDGFCSIKSDANQNMTDLAPINWILDITRKKFLQKSDVKQKTTNIALINRMQDLEKYLCCFIKSDVKQKTTNIALINRMKDLEKYRSD